MLRASISSHCSKCILLVHLTAWFTRNAAGLLSEHSDDARGEGSLRNEFEDALEVCTGTPYLYLAAPEAPELVVEEASDSAFSVKPPDVFMNLSKVFSSGTSGLTNDNAGL
jgi:hypothetical protein